MMDKFSASQLNAVHNATRAYREHMRSMSSDTSIGGNVDGTFLQAVTAQIGIGTGFGESSVVSRPDLLEYVNSFFDLFLFALPKGTRSFSLSAGFPNLFAGLGISSAKLSPFSSKGK